MKTRNTITSAYHPNSNTKTTRKSEININLYITTTLNTNNIPLSSSFSETHKTTLKLTLPIQSLAKHAGNWKFTARFKVMQQKWIMKRHKWFSVSVMKSWKKDLCSAFISEQAAQKKKWHFSSAPLMSSVSVFFHVGYQHLSLPQTTTLPC